ncbi:MAG: hypothetical protein ACM3IJ_05060 [Candidatus Levyibacteriota bacterium]
MTNLHEIDAAPRHIPHSPSQEIFMRRREHSPHRLALAHVTDPENVRPVVEGRMCGDGRYTESDGNFARFGADAGYVLGLLALNRSHDLGLTPVQIVNAVVKNSEGKFSFHTDEKAEQKAMETEEHHHIGCGHLAKAALPEYASQYGVEPEDVKTAISYMRYFAAIHPEKVEMIVLRGEHAEKGVLINVGSKNKVEHGNRFADQWFVVNPGHDEDYAVGLFDKMRKELPVLEEKEISPSEFMATLSKQTIRTAEILAAGLPVFEVDVDHPIPTVNRVESF